MKRMGVLFFVVALGVSGFASITVFRGVERYQTQRTIVPGDYVTLVSWSGPASARLSSRPWGLESGTCSFTVKKGSRTIVLEVPSERVTPDENLESYRLLVAQDAQTGAPRYLFNDPTFESQLAQQPSVESPSGSRIGSGDAADASEQRPVSPRTSAPQDSSRTVPNWP